MAKLWKHPNGYYYIRHSKGRESLGTKNERTANRKFNNWLRDRERGKPLRERDNLKSIKLYDFVDEFLEHVEARYPDSTYKLYDQGLKKIKSSWRDIPVKSITTHHIDSLLTDLSRSGLSPATINKNYRHIKSALRKAIEWGYLAQFKFPPPVKEEEQVRYIPEKDLKKLFAVITDEEFYDFCLFAVYSGLRAGELIRLTPRDVDNPQGFLRISSEQKNKAESRIPINENMRGVLNRRNNSGKVFRFKTVNWVSQKFKKYLKDAGIEQYRFHDLRHSFGSYLAMQGHSPKTIQELMRHKSIASTMVYLNLSPEHLTKASNGLKINLQSKKTTKKKSGDQ